MKRTNRILPVYAADISGICSALYELGGMTVMHDASGCNSTYTTHDEPRWYSMDSMVYISALSELEAVMGDDEKLVRDIVDAALNLCPAFICIGGTPIPMMMGTDFKGIARMIENKTGIPTFGIATNGMHSYVRGAGEALRWIVKRFCPPGIKADRSAALKVNILGVTPLDFSLTGNTARLKDFLRSHGMETVGCWAMESGLDELRLAGLADINLVVSAVGLPAAAELKKMYGTPWWWVHLWAGEHPGVWQNASGRRRGPVKTKACLMVPGMWPHGMQTRASGQIWGLPVCLRIYPAERFLSLGNRS